MLLFPSLLGLSRVGDVASAVENVSAAYSDTTVAPHEYFDQTGSFRTWKETPSNLRVAADLCPSGGALSRRGITASENAGRTHRSEPLLAV